MIIPPKPLANELESLMLKLNSQYYTSKALMYYKPHVTLKSLGKISDEKFKEASDEICCIAGDIEPFSLTMEGLRFYGSNESFSGIYIPVQKSPELVELHTKLATGLKPYSDRKDRSYKEFESWNPHLTLVGDDISSEDLEKAKKELHDVSYSYSFPVDKITLVRHTEEKVLPCFYWEMHFGLKE